MTRRIGLLLVATGAMLLACVGVVLAQTAEKPDTPGSSRVPQQSRAVPDRYIVVLAGEAGEAARNGAQDPARVAGAMAGEYGFEVDETYSHALRGFAAEVPAGELDELRSDPRVDYIVQDRVVAASSQTLPNGVNRVDADQSSAAAGDGVGAVDEDIAIVDSGIYKTHPDLNIAGGYNCTSSNAASWSDGNGHGTHVAGTAAARDNASGVVGVAPGARVWSVRVLDNSGFGSTSSVICGIDWVAANADAIEVANLSLGASVGAGASADDGNCGRTARGGSLGTADAVHRAVCGAVGAGVTFVAAAGNDGRNSSEQYPAAYDEVITVSALADYNGEPFGAARAICAHDFAPDDDFARFSNFGPDVDIGAPGVCIKSTAFIKKKVRGKVRIVPGYKTMSGTSMASPHVAGAAALYRSAHPSDTPAQVRAVLTSTANTEAEGEGHVDLLGFNPEPVMIAENY